MRTNSKAASTDPSAVVCPTCGKRFLVDETKSAPFCSQRCQMADLGKWLNEDIGVPHEGDPGDVPVEYLDHDQ